MAVCAHCGAYVGMDDSFCQNCGAAAPTPGAPAGAGPGAAAPGPPPGPGEPGAVPPQAPVPTSPPLPGYTPPPAPAPYTPPPPPHPEAGGLPPAPPPPPGYPGYDAPPGTFGGPPAYGAPGGGDWQIPGTLPPGSFGGPPMGAYAQGPGGYQASVGLATWGSRAGGWLIDFLIVFVLDIIGLVLGSRVYFIFQLLGIAVQVWFAVQIGQTGQSPGMRVVGLKCVGRQTGQPIGPGMAIVRAICHIIDSAICAIGWLFPLWDKNRQTLADKICGTVVLRVPATGFSLTPPSA